MLTFETPTATFFRWFISHAAHYPVEWLRKFLLSSWVLWDGAGLRRCLQSNRWGHSAIAILAVVKASIVWNNRDNWINCWRYPHE
ncbi:MAG TPA: hypothetical protein DCQ32_09145 [Cyanobacteria bacterium UBA8156]|nr:hypothetical protein [Cyanobacteria bacterium UBA8156]